jgi:hypothetical protein
MAQLSPNHGLSLLQPINILLNSGGTFPNGGRETIDDLLYKNHRLYGGIFQKENTFQDQITYTELAKKILGKI